MSISYAHVTPEVLRWARESMGITLREAADELGLYAYQIELAEDGGDLLTLHQAEELAKLYDRSLATFFMPEPPLEDSPETQFRRLPGAPELPWPSAMHRLSRRVRARQEAAAELLDALEEPPQWPAISRKIAVVSKPLATTVRDLLGIPLGVQQGWQDPSGYAPLRAWVDAVEALGILVMQDGSMGVNDLRGFASLHDAVPAIVINTKDDPRARAFTVIHELAHVVADAAGRADKATEPWCNEFAGQVIVPPDALEAAFAAVAGSLEQRVAALALTFGITRLAAVVRLTRAGLMDQESGDSLAAELRARDHQPQRTRGGDYYRNKITWLGPAFTRLVLEAVDDQALTASNAAGLLVAKVNHFGRLRETLEARSAFG